MEGRLVVVLVFKYYFSLLACRICTLLHTLVWDVIFSDDVCNILENIVRLKSALTNIVEPDFGLLDELMRLEGLTRPELADVRSERTVYRRNAAFLDLLASEEQCDKFLKALERTGQRHIVKFVRGNGGQKTVILCKLCSINKCWYAILYRNAQKCRTERYENEETRYEIILYSNNTVYRLWQTFLARLAGLMV